MENLLIWLLFGIFGIVSAVIASNKGRNGFGWFALGVLLGPFGFILALVVPKNQEVVEKGAVKSGVKKRGIVIGFLAVVLFSAVLVFSLKSYSGESHINIVKKAPLSSLDTISFMTQYGLKNQDDFSSSIGSRISKIVGLSGKVDWSEFTPNVEKYSSSVRCINVSIQVPQMGNTKKIAVFQFLVNTETGYIEIGYFAVDGKPKSKMDAVLALQYGSL